VAIQSVPAAIGVHSSARKRTDGGTRAGNRITSVRVAGSQTTIC